MYRHCIFCNADLGANNAIEHFPTGNRLAFDAASTRHGGMAGRSAPDAVAPCCTAPRWQVREEHSRSVDWLPVWR